MKRIVNILPIFVVLIVGLLSFSKLYAKGKSPKNAKIILCGIGKNVAPFVGNTIENMEKLGSHFKDYAVIIYENNSRDESGQLFSEWAQKNPKVTFVGENLRKDEILPSRCENIARARNKVLDISRMAKYYDYEYLLMVDLDFFRPYPIEAILETIQDPREWDCVGANGMRCGYFYFDRYAFRDETFPLGPELIGDYFWEQVNKQVTYPADNDWAPVFAAYGGMAIYKIASIRNCRFSGTVTKDLRKYYKKIICSLPNSHEQIQYYLQLNGIPSNTESKNIPIIFRKNTEWEHAEQPDRLTCIEHVTFNASMAMKGHGKIFINPKMVMPYD